MGMSPWNIFLLWLWVVHFAKGPTPGMAAFSGTGAEKEGGGQATLENHLPDTSVPELVRVDSDDVAGKNPSRCNVSGVIDEVIVTGTTTKVLKSISSIPYNKSSDGKEFHSSSENNKKKRRRRKSDKMVVHSVESSSSSSLVGLQKKEDEQEDYSACSKISLGPLDAPAEKNSSDLEKNRFQDESQVTNGSAHAIPSQQKYSNEPEVKTVTSINRLSDALVNQSIRKSCQSSRIVQDLSGHEVLNNSACSQSASANENFSEVGTCLSNDFIAQLLLDRMGFLWKNGGTNSHLHCTIVECEAPVPGEVCTEVAMDLVSNEVNNHTINQLNINTDNILKIMDEDAVSFEHQADRSEYEARVIIQPLITDILQTVIASMKHPMNDVNNYEGKGSDTRHVKNVLVNGSQQVRLKTSAVLSLSKFNAQVKTFELHFYNRPWIEQVHDTCGPGKMQIFKEVDNAIKRSRHVRAMAMKSYNDRLAHKNMDLTLNLIVARLNFILAACGQPHERMPFYMRPLVFDGRHMTLDEIYDELELSITETSLPKTHSRSILGGIHSKTENEVKAENKAMCEVDNRKMNLNCSQGDSSSIIDLVQFIESLLLDSVPFSTITNHETVNGQENILHASILPGDCLDILRSESIDTNVSSGDILDTSILPRKISGQYSTSNSVTVETKEDTSARKDLFDSRGELGSSSAFGKAYNELLSTSSTYVVSLGTTNDVSLNRQFAYTNLLNAENPNANVEVVDCRPTLSNDSSNGSSVRSYSSLDLCSIKNETSYRHNYALTNISEEPISMKNYADQQRQDANDVVSIASRSGSECSSHSSESYIRESIEDVSITGWSGSDSSTQILNVRKLYTIPEVSCESGSLSEDSAVGSTVPSEESLYALSTGEPLKQLAQDNETTLPIQFTGYKSTTCEENESSYYIVTHPDTDVSDTCLSVDGSTNHSDTKTTNVRLKIDEEPSNTGSLSVKNTKSGQILKVITDNVTEVITENSEINTEVLRDTSGKCMLYEPNNSFVPLTSRETIQYSNPTTTYGIQTDISFGEITNPILKHTSPLEHFKDDINSEESFFEMNTVETVCREIDEIKGVAAQIKSICSNGMQSALTVSDEHTEPESTRSLNASFTGVVLNETPATQKVLTIKGSNVNLLRNDNDKLPPTFVKKTDPVAEVLDEVCRDLTFLSKGICSHANVRPMKKPLIYNSNVSLGPSSHPKVCHSSINESDSLVGDTSSNKVMEELYSAGDGTKSPSSGSSLDRFESSPLARDSGSKALDDICENLQIKENMQEMGHLEKCKVFIPAEESTEPTHDKYDEKKNSIGEATDNLSEGLMQNNNHPSSKNMFNTTYENYEQDTERDATEWQIVQSRTDSVHERGTSDHDVREADNMQPQFITETMNGYIGIENHFLLQQMERKSSDDDIHVMHNHNGRAHGKETFTADALDPCTEACFDHIPTNELTVGEPPLCSEECLNMDVGSYLGVDAAHQVSKPFWADNSTGLLPEGQIGGIRKGSIHRILPESFEKETVNVMTDLRVMEAHFVLNGVNPSYAESIPVGENIKYGVIAGELCEKCLTTDKLNINEESPHINLSTAGSSEILEGASVSLEQQEIIPLEPLEAHIEVSSKGAFQIESCSDIKPSLTAIHHEVIYAEGEITKELEFQCSDLQMTCQTERNSTEETSKDLEELNDSETCTGIRRSGYEKLGTVKEEDTDNELDIGEDNYTADGYEIEITEGRIRERKGKESIMEVYRVDTNRYSGLADKNDALSAYNIPHRQEYGKKITPERCKHSVTNSGMSLPSVVGFKNVKTNNSVGLGLTFSNRNIFADICNEADNCKISECSESPAVDFVNDMQTKQQKTDTNTLEQEQPLLQSNLCHVDELPSHTFGSNGGCHDERPNPDKLLQPLELSSYENIMITDTHNTLLHADIDSDCESLSELSAVVENGQTNSTGNNSSYEMIRSKNISSLVDASPSTEDVLTPHLTSSNEDLRSKVTADDGSETMSSPEITHKSEVNTATTPSRESVGSDTLQPNATWSYENLHQKGSTVFQQSVSTSSECLHIGITAFLKPPSPLSNENSLDDASAESNDSSFANVHARVIIEQPSSSTSSENTARIVVCSVVQSSKAPSTESMQIEDMPSSTMSSYENIPIESVLVKVPSSSSSSDSMHQINDSSAPLSSKATSHESIRCENLSLSPLSSFENIAPEHILPQSPTARKNLGETIPISETTLSTGSFEALAAHGSNSLHSATSHNSILLPSCSSGSSTSIYRSHARDITGLMEYVGKLNSLTNGRECSDKSSSGIARSLSTPVVDSARDTNLMDEPKSEVRAECNSEFRKAVKRPSSVECDDDDQDQTNTTVFSKLSALRRFMPFTCFLSPTTSDMKIMDAQQNVASPRPNSKSSEVINNTTSDNLDQELD